MDSSTADKLAAAKARVEALNARMNNPYLSGSGGFPKAETKPVAPAPQLSSSVALHPLLMGETRTQEALEKNEKRAMRDRYKTMAPKFTSVKVSLAG